MFLPNTNLFLAFWETQHVLQSFPAPGQEIKMSISTANMTFLPKTLHPACKFWKPLSFSELSWFGHTCSKILEKLNLEFQYVCPSNINMLSRNECFTLYILWENPKMYIFMSGFSLSSVHRRQEIFVVATWEQIHQCLSQGTRRPVMILRQFLQMCEFVSCDWDGPCSDICLMQQKLCASLRQKSLDSCPVSFKPAYNSSSMSMLLTEHGIIIRLLLVSLFWITWFLYYSVPPGL
jgi:hypothetical protein